jgi:polyhydroxyalkanoate synthesis repressor PhaR
MSKLRIIKKYPNRRLYDTAISSYITIEDVRQLVVDQEVFEVRDAKTGEDITRSVLLQIIAEHEEQGHPMFSANMLSQVIRSYGDSLQGVMGSYLERSVQTFLDQSQNLRSQLSNMMTQTPWGMLNDLTEKNLELWNKMQSNLLKPGAGPNTSPESEKKK